MLMKPLSSSNSIVEQFFSGRVTAAFPLTRSILALCAKTGAFFSPNSTLGCVVK
jgi:hypothetical protein